ncbi:glycosyltransferase family 1 protein, partial [Micromonospora sp. PSH25]|nr:glycosyltransferase family 1 protein [Micromonospora foliorum]
VAELTGDAGRRRAYGLAARVAVSRRSWAAVGDELVGHYHAVRTVAATVGLPAAS